MKKSLIVLVLILSAYVFSGIVAAEKAEIRPAYLIVEVEVRDHKLYSKYVEKVPEVIAKYGGRYLARSEKIAPLTGTWKPKRIILIEFPSIEHLRKCFKSPEYLKLAPLREESTISKAIIVEGYQPPG